MSTENKNIYDVIIIGAGPAGYTAAIYCRRANLKTLIIERLTPGGQMGLTDTIDNYPGYPDGISGFELAMNMKKGADRFGTETVMSEVREIDLNGALKKVKTSKEEYAAKAIVLAMGSHPKLLGVPGEIELTGMGVSYCATCDGMFYKDKTVAVIGGGNTAVGDAMYLSKICKKVYLVHRRDSLRASKLYVDYLSNTENIEVLWNTVSTSINGSPRIESLELESTASGEKSTLSVDGVFVAIGNIPNSSLVEGQVELDSEGYIVADETTRTSIDGVFAIGDLRKKPLRQIVTATADGAMASLFAEEHILSLS